MKVTGANHHPACVACESFISIAFCCFSAVSVDDDVGDDVASGGAGVSDVDGVAVAADTAGCAGASVIVVIVVAAAGPIGAAESLSGGCFFSVEDSRFEGNPQVYRKIPRNPSPLPFFRASLACIYPCT